MRWLLQFTVREDEVKQNRKLPEIALFDTNGNQITLGSSGPIAAWAPTTDYSVGQVVVNSGHLYQAVDDHTSGTTFGADSAHWTALDSETDALALSQLATHAGLTTSAHGGIVSSADGRLTDARTPTAHKASHATGGSDVLSPADIGAATASDLATEQTARTTHAGLTTTAHGGIVASSDSRLTDARTPTAHKTSHATGGSDVLSPSDIGAVASSDSRLTDARTPTAHKTSHAVGGSDVLSPADIGAIAKSLVDAKGDLLVGTADDTVARKAAGSNGKFLSSQSGQSDGLLWDDPVTARTSMNWTTGSLANNAEETSDQTLAKACQAYSITTDRAARVRAYSTSAHRTADSARAAGTDPTGNHGCLLDVVTTGGMLTVDLSPVVDLVNLDGTPATTIYFAVQNLSGSTSTVNVAITYRREE